MWRLKAWPRLTVPPGRTRKRFFALLDTPYTGVLAVREQDKNQPWVQALIKSYQSAPVRDFINEHFKGALLPAF